MTEWSIERVGLTVVVLVVSFVCLSSIFSWNTAPTKESLLGDVPVNPILAEHSKHFPESTVLKVGAATQTMTRLQWLLACTQICNTCSSLAQLRFLFAVLGFVFLGTVCLSGKENVSSG